MNMVKTLVYKHDCNQMEKFKFYVVVILQMLSTVLNIIMFEDCRNQWSMSRPLLGLILLNEEVGTVKTKNQIITF